MTLSINSTFDVITVSSTLLDSFIAAPASYTDIDVKGYFNSTTDSTTKTYSSTNLITASTDVATSGGVETINPSFFGGTVFAKGVYHFVITLTGASIQTDEGCLFVDDGVKCDVDTFMLDTNKTLQKRLLMGSTYFLLTSVADCACDCDKMITLYNNIVTDLSTATCKTC